jgi:hypothetical protein
VSPFSFSLPVVPAAAVGVGPAPGPEVGGSVELGAKTRNYWGLNKQELKRGKKEGVRDRIEFFFFERQERRPTVPTSKEPKPELPASAIHSQEQGTADRRVRQPARSEHCQRTSPGSRASAVEAAETQERQELSLRPRTLERKEKKNSPVPRSVSAVASAGDAPLFVQNNLVVRDVLVDFDLLVVDVDDLVVA